jgi:hypothetical protein
MLSQPSFRRALSNIFALLGAFAIVGVFVALESRAWISAVTLTAITAFGWFLAFKLNRSPPSQAATTGHITLFETPLPGVTLSQTPALTIRGPRDAVERFIPLKDFGRLFGGWATWGPPARPTPEMPGEAIGVWSKRTCKRFRRVLRERGATLDVRREVGPEQRLSQMVSTPHVWDHGPENTR